MAKEISVFETQMEAINKGIITENDLLFIADINKKFNSGNLESITLEERLKRKDILKRYNEWLYQ